MKSKYSVDVLKTTNKLYFILTLSAGTPFLSAGTPGLAFTSCGSDFVADVSNSFET